jgi:hypothetical protein
LQKGWDGIELRQVQLHDCDRTLDVHRIDASKMPGAVEESRAIVECQGDWIRFLRSRPNDVREQYRRSERTLAERGELEHARYRPEGTPLNDDDPQWELFSEVEGGQLASGSDADRRQVLREMHETAATIAGVDLNLLRLNGKPIAWAYNYRCDGRLELQRLYAVDEYSPAARCVLLGRMLSDGFRRGDESYLFDRETSRTAGGWQTGRATSCRRMHYSRRGARAQFARFLGRFGR